MGRRERRDNIHGWLFISPAILIFTTFIFLPMGVAFFVSLQKWNMLSPMRFVGFANYARMLQSDHFWNSLRVSLLYVVGKTCASPDVRRSSSTPSQPVLQPGQLSG